MKVWLVIRTDYDYTNVRAAWDSEDAATADCAKREAEDQRESKALKIPSGGWHVEEHEVQNTDSSRDV